MCRHRSVLHIAIATGLVQLVAREASTCSRRVRLNGVTLIKEILLVELLQQPPKRLDVLIIIGNIGVFHIHPITHAVAQVFPLARVHHHVLATLLVVILNRDSLTDIFLRNTQFLLYAQFHRQSVGVPSCLAVYLEALHRLKATEGVLNGTSQYVMYTWMSISRWRTFEKDKRGTTLTLIYAAVEEVFLIPSFQFFFIHFREVQSRAFCESFCHILYLSFYSLLF